MNSSFFKKLWKYKYKLKIGKPWFSRDVTKIQTPKSQGLLRFYLHLAKDLLKINFCASFQRDSVFCFENINNFNAWYYALWMVKVFENVFRRIICSFAVNWSNFRRYWNQMFALFPADRHTCAPRRSTNMASP